MFYLQVGKSLSTLRLCVSVSFFTQEQRKRLQCNIPYYESFPSTLLTDTNGGKDFYLEVHISHQTHGGLKENVRAG